MLRIHKNHIFGLLLITSTVTNIFYEAIDPMASYNSEGVLDVFEIEEEEDFNVGNDAKVPEGVIPAHRTYFPSVDSIRLDDKLIMGHPTTGKVFSVSPSHQRLQGEEGVVFSVEDSVSDPADRNMPVLSREAEITQAQWDGEQYYGGKRNDKRSEVHLEQLSKTPPNLVYSGGHAFLAAVLTAFAKHLPLVVGPDQIWSLISFGFAQHVDQNAKELRHHFVSHQGKKRLEVKVAPGFGRTPEEWENVVFPNFSSQIRGYIGEDIHDAIAGSFTTTSDVARAAHEVTLMSAMKHYFSYGMETFCGISRITLLGTEADWVQLRDRAEALGNKMTAEVHNLWLPKLLPVLDQFVAAYKGDVHHGFWQSMVKMRHKDAFGSGESSKDYVTGWLQIFFPYLNNSRLNKNMKHWEHCYWEGPETGDFPSMLSSAPVDWDGKELHFHAGITGFTQDPTDGALRPVLGWRITNDPEKEAENRIIDKKMEIKELLLGMTGDKSDELNQKRIHAIQDAIHGLEDDIKKRVIEEMTEGVEHY